MSKARLIALAGPLIILVGSVWLVASIGDLVLRTGLANAEMFVAFWSLLFFLSFVPLLFALIGARLRFHQSAGVLGRLGLALSVAGCAGVIISVLAQLLLSGVAPEDEQRSWVNYAALVCFLSIRIGYILFGVDALRHRLLPRWNLLPLLVGSTVVLSLPFDWFGVPGILPVQWATLSALCHQWRVLDTARHCDHRPEARTAASSGDLTRSCHPSGQHGPTRGSASGLSPWAAARSGRRVVARKWLTQRSFGMMPQKSFTESKAGFGEQRSYRAALDECPAEPAGAESAGGLESRWTYSEIMIALLLGGAGLAALARRLTTPYPALVALAGAALALVPGVPTLTLDPELALALFVAPVLLDTAFDSSPRDLRANWRPVVSLAIGAVVLTIVMVALVARAVVPGMPWAAAIALGAIVAPPMRRLRPQCCASCGHHSGCSSFSREKVYLTMRAHCLCIASQLAPRWPVPSQGGACSPRCWS